MLKKLVLENYRCYDYHVVDFSDKLTTIKGRNGTGKTSIVEAISYALFGAALQRGKANEWIKHGEKTGSVILYIDDYIITRSPTLATVTNLEGETLARNSTGITTWVEREYGLTAELFRTSFYIGQKDINGFSSLGAVDRVKRVERLLRINRLDEIKVSAKSLSTAKAQTVQNLKDRLDSAEFDLLIISQLTLEIKDKYKTIAELRTELETKLIAHGAYKEELEKYNLFTRTSKLFKGTTFDIVTLEKKLEETIEANARVTENNKLFREKVRLEKNLDGITILDKYFTLQISDVMAQVQTYKKRKEVLDALAKLDSEPVKHTNLDAKWLEIIELKKEINLAENIPASCPTCKQSWPVEQIDVKPLKLALKEKELWYEEADNENAYYEDLKALPEEQELSAVELEVAMQSLNYKNDYLRLQELLDYEELEELNTTSQRQSITFAREQNRLADILKELGKIEKPVEVNITVIKDSITNIEKALVTLEQELRAQKQAEAIHQEYSSMYDTQHAEVVKLREFVTFIDKYRKTFGQNVIPLLESNVSSIVNFLSEGKYEKVVINNDYSIKDFDYFSGSEQDSVSFALRLALAQVSRIGGFKTMLLDEVAASFDNEREKLLMQVLDSQDNQLIYITHGEI